MTPRQEKLGEMSPSEISIIQALREDSRRSWYLYGKSLEISLSIEDSNYRPIMNKGQSSILRFMIAIDKYIECGQLSENLITLIKMKKSKYREALIEYGVWTEDIYLDIYNKYTQQKKIS